MTHQGFKGSPGEGFGETWRRNNANSDVPGAQGVTGGGLADPWCRKWGMPNMMFRGFNE